MRIATWNVNSIRTRVGRVVDWLERADVDVLAMQEIKCKPEQFPHAAFEAAGYDVAVHGLNQWNGVALASRLPITEVETEFPGMPGFLKGAEGPDLPREARALGATIDDVRVWSLYVPNGRALDDPHYAYKLDWLAALRTATEGWLRADPELPVLGTCAGVILLADPQDGGAPLIDSTVDRNAYGRQQDSFQSELEISGIGDSGTFSGVFIRAPRFAEISANDTVVAKHRDEVVGVRNGARLALTFHPELSGDTTFHRWLLEAVLLRATA